MFLFCTKRWNTLHVDIILLKTQWIWSISTFTQILCVKVAGYTATLLLTIETSSLLKWKPAPDYGNVQRSAFLAELRHTISSIYILFVLPRHFLHSQYNSRSQSSKHRGIAYSMNTPYLFLKHFNCHKTGSASGLLVSPSDDWSSVKYLKNYLLD